MGFEWDDEKNKTTQKTRGLSFDDAKSLWSSPDVLEVPARTEGEPRWAKIGVIFGKVHVCIFTRRDRNIRIISVRRAHPEEEKRYEQKKNEN